MWEFPAKKTDRLDRQLRECGLAGSEWLSRQAWDWLLENGYVQLLGRVARKAGQEVQVGARIQVRFPREPLGLIASVQPAELLWSDPQRRLAIFHKASGVPSLSIFPWEHESFANQVAAFLEKNEWMTAGAFASLAAPPSLEGGLLQRLDQDTSGVVAVALEPDCKRLFRELFSRSVFEKSYLALITSGVEGLEGSHEVWLNAEGGARVKASLSPLKGKAERALLQIEICKISQKGALVRVRTRQGLRHVVRAGMSALGAPLLGDHAYGGSPLVTHHQLHAESLRLLEPSAFPAFPSDLEQPPPHGFLDSAALLGLN